MNRSTVFSVALVAVLVLQGGAAAAISGSVSQQEEDCSTNDSGAQSAFPSSVFAGSENCSGGDSGSSTGSNPSTDSASTDTATTSETVEATSESDSASNATETATDSDSNATTTDETASENASNGSAEATSSETATDSDSASTAAAADDDNSSETTSATDADTQAAGSSNGDSSADSGSSDSGSADDSESSGDGNATDGSSGDDSAETTTAAEDTETETASTDTRTADNADAQTGTAAETSAADQESEDGSSSATSTGAGPEPNAQQTSQDQQDSQGAAASAANAAVQSSGQGTQSNQSGQTQGTTQQAAAPTGSQQGAGGDSRTTAQQAPRSQQATAGQGATQQGAAGQSAAQQATAGQGSGAGASTAASGATGGGASGAGAAGGGTGSGAANASGQSAGAAQQASQSSDAEFEIVSSDSDLAVGASGTVSVTIENTGEDAENAAVTLQSQTGELTFGQSASTSQFVGEWDEGETRTIEVDANAAPSAGERSYPVQATVAYQDDDGNQVQSNPTTFGVTPEAEQNFTLTDLDSSLSAGSQGTISGTITNNGPADATNAVLVFGGNTSDVTPRQSEVVLDDIESGESVDFEYPVSVRQGAAPGERQLPLVVQYRNEDGETVSSSTLNAQVTIEENTDDFEVTNVDSDLEPGQQGTVSVTIENTDEDLTDATINLQTLSSSVAFGEAANASQFVGDWEEGETQTIEVQATAAQGTTEGEYPVQASVSYTDSDNEPGQGGPLTFGVEVGTATDDFNITNVDSDLEPGQQGTVSVTVENTDEDLTDATISLQTLSSSIAFGEAANASQFVGDWEEGETRTIEVQTVATQGTTEGEYPMQASISYTDPDNNQQGQSGPLQFGVEVGAATDDFEVTNVSSGLQPGERGTVSVTVENTDEDLTDATINLQTLSSSVAFGEAANASQFVGDWEEGETQTIEVQATAAQGTTEGEYPMQASVSYTDPDNNQQGRSGPLQFGVEVGTSQNDFEITNIDSSVPIGDQGTVSITMENTGENATEATVSLQSLSADLSLGQAANATRFVGAWPAGENRTVTYQVTASNESERRSYPFRTSISYNDESNQQSSAGPYTIGVTPDREQAFSLSNTTSNLSVGDEGTVTGTITNEGPQPITNAVVVLTVNNQNLNPQETEVAIGSLAPGQSANFSYTIEVSDNGVAGNQQLSFAVEYDNSAGDPRTSDTLDTQVQVDPQEDEFAVVTESNNASLAPGDSRVVTLNVTNNRNSPVTSIEAQAFTNSPLSLTDDQAFISRLGPGESATVSFEVSASGSATPGEYPLSLDFQYETQSGDTRLTDTYQVPIRIEESDDGGLLSLSGGGLPIALIVLVIIVAAAIALVWYRRQGGSSE